MNKVVLTVLTAAITQAEVERSALAEAAPQARVGLGVAEVGQQIDALMGGVEPGQSEKGKNWDTQNVPHKIDLRYKSAPEGYSVL